LILDLPGNRRWAIEVKRGAVPTVGRGFHQALGDVQADRAFVVYSGDDRYGIGDRVEAIGLRGLAEELRGS
jgi:uncharacterized protein